MLRARHSATSTANVLGVNTNTVLRALHILRDEGLIEMGRGRATIVAGTPEQSAVQAKIKELLDLARYHGYRRDELVAMIQRQP
jgi:GntR family transcriptional regulator